MLLKRGRRLRLGPVGWPADGDDHALHVPGGLRGLARGRPPARGPGAPWASWWRSDHPASAPSSPTASPQSRQTARSRPRAMPSPRPIRGWSRPRPSSAVWPSRCSGSGGGCGPAAPCRRCLLPPGGPERLPLAGSPRLRADVRGGGPGGGPPGGASAALRSGRLGRGRPGPPWLAEGPLREHGSVAGQARSSPAPDRRRWCHRHTWPGCAVPPPPARPSVPTSPLRSPDGAWAVLALIVVAPLAGFVVYRARRPVEADPTGIRVAQALILAAPAPAPTTRRPLPTTCPCGTPTGAGTAGGTTHPRRRAATRRSLARPAHAVARAGAGNGTGDAGREIALK